MLQKDGQKVLSGKYFPKGGDNLNKYIGEKNTSY